MALRKHNAPYTAAELARMRKLAGKGLSSRQVAEELGRTTGAVKYKAMVEGIAFNAIAQPKGVQLRLARKRRKIGMHATLRQQAAA